MFGTAVQLAIRVFHRAAERDVIGGVGDNPRQVPSHERYPYFAPRKQCGLPMAFRVRRSMLAA
ncbi:MAG TPA: hypothetical protein VG365_12005 [Solirubrobacteraceae bacterium]|nr:hypothetical protein [Solirubrobacteraceae bacterium]